MVANSVSTGRYISPSLYGLAILLFLLPFAEIRCNDVAFARNSGIGLALGADFKTAGQARSLQDSFETGNDTKSNSTKGSGKMYISVLASLILGIIGLILYLTGSRSRMTHIIIGSLAAVSLLILLFQLKSDVREKAGNDAPTEKAESVFEDVRVTTNFTFWYFLAVGSFLGVAGYNYVQRKKEMAHEAPPPGAPQIKNENPGDQSEFPKSASESDLG